MAGVDVEVTADFGWAWARVAFGAHGIVYFDPFWFEVIAYARISAGVKIKTFFGTISFSISIGAQIKVWGPEFSGRATLEVGPCDITVGFGSERRVEPRTLNWAEFVAKYLEDAGGGRPGCCLRSPAAARCPAATNGGRSAPTSDGTPGRPFEVFAEFEITVVTMVPTARIDLGLGSGPVNVPLFRSDGMPVTLGLKPMGAGNLNSTLRIRLEQQNPITKVWTAIPGQLRLLGANLAAPQPRPEGSSVGRDSYPIGTWGAPDLPGLPAVPLPRGDVVRAGNQVRLVAEAVLSARGPEIDYYRVEAARRPLPLQAGGPSRSDVVTTAGTVPLPSTTTVAAALQAASVRLFVSAPPTMPEGLLSPGARSALARAAYRGEVSAPPLFGTLADGIAELNATDATAARTQPGPGPVSRPLRPPVVAGYLASGSGVALRASGTTVADARIKRRTAPTLDSVQARLGRHLPVRMHATAPPAVEQAGTVSVERVPRTEATGAIRSYPLGSSALAGVVGGIAGGFGPARRSGPRARARAAAEARLLAAGEMVVLGMPDAAADPDVGATAEQRPALVVDGRARITMLRGDGEVVTDAVIADDPAGGIPVPPGVALIAVQADGTVDDGDGVAGWHVRSRVCSLGSNAAWSDGCIITTEGGPTVRGTSWVTAAELLAGAAAVRTWFSRPVQTVAIVLEEGEADRLGAVSFDLSGAHRQIDADGTEAPPRVLLSSEQAVLIYSIVPNEAGHVSVRVRSGGDWQVTGVLGGLDAENLSQAIIRNGVVAAVGRILAGTGDGCRISWLAPRTRRLRNPAAKKATAKKTTVKKATTGKSSTTKGGRRDGRR